MRGDLLDIQDMRIRPADGCGVAVVVRYRFVHNNPELIDAYQVAMFDHRQLLKDIKEAARLREAAEKKRIDEETKKVVPNRPRI